MLAVQPWQDQSKKEPAPGEKVAFRDHLTDKHQVSYNNTATESQDLDLDSRFDQKEESDFKSLVELWTNYIDRNHDLN